VGESTADVIERCDAVYYEEKYSDLWHDLRLYDAYDENFDVYWEMVNGYRDYMQYKQWVTTPVDKIPESTEMAESYRKKVIENAENCKFDQNKKKLAAYAKEITE